MPAEYPQSKAPSFALSGIWLSEAAKGSVHKLLEALWVENGPGVPICFAWIEALKSTLLESIGASEQLMITNVHQEQGVDNYSMQPYSWELCCYTAQVRFGYSMLCTHSTHLSCIRQ